MKNIIHKDYYINRKSIFIEEFNQKCQSWKSVIIKSEQEEFANSVLSYALSELEILIPQIPYIGGDENPRTHWLIDLAYNIAFYRAMKKHGKSVEETGKIIYDSVLLQLDKPSLSKKDEDQKSPEEFFKQARINAEESHKRRYKDDWVFTYVPCDGKEYIYGNDYIECGDHKFAISQNAEEFLPFYCYLDYPKAVLHGVSLVRTETLSEGDKKCNHRYKLDPEKKEKLTWPPPFLKKNSKK